MNRPSQPQFAFLPCSGSQTWAVPQVCLGEIVTVPADGDRPPGRIPWRDRDLPVLDLAAEEASHWRDTRGDNGLVAVLLGLEGDDGSSWGVAIDSVGLAIEEIDADRIEDAPGDLAEHATAAFRYDGRLYQVPDLQTWQGIAAQACQQTETEE